MIAVRVDTSKNCLFVNFEGKVEYGDAPMAAKRISDGLSLLSPGFTVISDISNFDGADHSEAGTLKDVFELFEKHQISQTIRIVGSSKKGLMLFAQLDKVLPHEFPITYVPTKEAAIELLETQKNMSTPET